MKRQRGAPLIALLWVVLVLGACGTAEVATPIVAAPAPTVGPVSTAASAPAVSPALARTPSPQPVEGLLNPGDPIGGMLLAAGGRYGADRLWEFCDSDVTEAGAIVRKCTVPARPSLFVGWGVWGDTIENLDAQWNTASWELELDGEGINLPAFGFADYDVGFKLRLWSVVLDRPTSGEHTLRYIRQSPEGVTMDVTWAFDVTSPAALDIPAGAELLRFAGTGGVFSTLAELDSLMRSAVASGSLDGFWDKVVALGQMPLIFGDNTALFLFRGKADSVESRGDFQAQYARQGETDLWAFLRRFEADARVEYKIVLDGKRWILDPLNPLTEVGGLGTTSVVRMPLYQEPAWPIVADEAASGRLSDPVTLASQSLGYRVRYRVYTPAGYDTLERLPAIYVTDGQDYINPSMGAMIMALDGLIAGKQIRPEIAVFIDPRDPLTGSNRREQEMVATGVDACPFCDFVAQELVPAVDAAYRTDASPDSRAILGFSLGGGFAAQMGLAYGSVFHLVAIQSPYLQNDWTLAGYQEESRLPLKVFLNHGTYDLGASSARLRNILEAKGYPLLYVETHEGHSFGTVRGVLADLLVYFFGTE